MTPYRRQLLIRLAEESAEVVQACTQLLAFGDREIPEGHAGAGMTNVEHLATELDDVWAVQVLLVDDGVDLSTKPSRILEKRARLAKRIAESLLIEAADVSQQAVLEERKACASLVRNYAKPPAWIGRSEAEGIADAIMSRGSGEDG